MDDTLNDELSQAVSVGNLSEVIRLIETYEKNASSYRYPPNINRHFIQSVQQENLPLTNLFLKKYGANVKIVTDDYCKNKPIHIAVTNGNIELAKEILFWGSPINISNGWGQYPINIAVKRNDIEMVKLLIKEGASINRTGAGPGRTFDAASSGFDRYGRVEHPLHRSILNKNWDMFELLLRKGASINAVNNHGHTCINYCIKTQQFTILQKLCERGADLDQGNPLQMALLYNSFEMAKTLISYGAKVTPDCSVLTDLPMIFKRDVHCDSELHQFVYKEILSGSRNVINARDHRDYTPLHHAAVAKSVRFAKILLEHGADVNALSCKSRETPLHIAVGPDGSPELALLLLENGAEILCRDPGCEQVLNCLALAAGSGLVDVKLLKKLIEKGAMINPCGNGGYTPLERFMLLSNQGVWLGAGSPRLIKKEVIAELVAAGARLQPTAPTASTGSDSISTAVKPKFTPLCRVTWEGHLSTSRFLIDCGSDITRESWIHLHGKTPEVETFMSELRDMATSPGKLVMLTRNKVRSEISRCRGDTDVRPSIDGLPLPPSVMSFLKLEKEVEMYLNSDGC